MIDIPEGVSFARVPTACLVDRNLSLKAKGLYSLICGCSPTWNCSARGFASFLKEGKDSIDAALHELETTGYLKRYRGRRENGKWSHWRYVLYCSPFMNLPETDFPTTDNPTNKIEQRKKNDEITIKENCSYLLTTSMESLEGKFGRKLSQHEIEIYRTWEDSNLDSRIILRAIKDNEFRKDKNNLKYVDQTLKTWEINNLTTLKEIDNHILDSKLKNTINLFKAKYPDDDEKVFDELQFNDTYRIANWRDVIVRSSRRNPEEFEQNLRDAPDEVFDYLSNDILERAAEVYEKTGRYEKRDAALKAIEGGDWYEK